MRLLAHLQFPSESHPFIVRWIGYRSFDGADGSNASDGEDTDLEMVIGAEPFATRGARVGRLSRVHAHVALEVAQLSETLAAVVADVPLLVQVDLTERGEGDVSSLQAVVSHRPVIPIL